mmetsp:Transcript_59096/g.158080  ORF Transcript_59096/g.158080 Transcript_59096/m.158080 type:complete len:647 (-) Transcript_59096:132-2072(-)
MSYALLEDAPRTDAPRIGGSCVTRIVTCIAAVLGVTTAVAVIDYVRFTRSFEPNGKLVAPVAFKDQPFGWQAHSINDLRQWRQLARKSPRSTLSIKLDPNTWETGKGFQLTHNDPMPGVTYNTSDEALVASEDILINFPQLNIRIAMCFKAGPSGPADPCDGSDTAAAWIKEVDRFYSKAEDLRMHHRGRFEVVLDGIAKPYKCLSTKWVPWVSTWIPLDHSPWTAMYVGDRFKILNLPDQEVLWALVAEGDYGVFRTGDYPMQVWEPDNQERLLEYAQAFISGPHKSSPELLFDYATNIDPMMWAVLTAGATGAAWNQALGTAVPAASGLSVTPTGSLVVLHHGEAEDAAPTYTGVRAEGGVFGLLTPEAPQPIPRGLVFRDHTVVPVLRKSGSIDLVSPGLHPHMETLPAAPGARAVAVTTSGHAVVLVDDGAGGLGARRINHTTAEWAEPHWRSQPFPAGRIASVAAVEGESFVVVASNGTHLYGAAAEGAWSFLGVGGNVSMTIMGGSDPVVALVADGGFCFNSHGDHASAKPKVCDKNPEPCPYALDATLGRLSKFRSAIAQGDQFSVCSDTLMHGTFSFGTRPHVALAIGPGKAPGAGDMLAVVVAHEPSPENVATCSCGTPIPREGNVVIDGFMVPLPN